MHHQRSDAGIDAVQNALRLAERIAEQHRGATRVGVAAPPVVDLGIERLLRRPAVDRQAEGRFGDEGVAGDRLERRAGAVGLRLVVARRNPDPPAVFEPYLRRTQHMPRRVQRQPDAVVRDGFAVGQRLQADVLAEPRAQRAFTVAVRQIVTVAGAGMVGMRMRDDGTRNRFPRVDVEVASRAIQALGSGDDQIHRLMLAARATIDVRPKKSPDLSTGASE